MAGAIAQSTIPHWSTTFGGSARDMIYAVRRGPGSLLTVVGNTTSPDLPVTPGALQQANGGGNDVFIARIDPALPPSLQVQWCTYLGGAGLDLVLDAEVDPATGITTVAGVTQSTNFPTPTGLPFPSLAGPSDGFVAQLDATGGVLLSSMFVGGTWDDRACEVEIEAGTFEVLLAGVTESFNLPGTAGTVGPTHHGGTTDAFVARVDPPSRTLRWATHLGGSNTEGMPWVNFTFGTVWETNLDRMALSRDPAGRPVLATVSFDAAVDATTTPNAIHTTPRGASDVYFVVLDLTGPQSLPTAIAYGTFHGGLLDDRPHAIAPHPAGGFVLGGYTGSANFTVTPGCVQPIFGGGVAGLAVDGFVTHLNPAFAGINGVRYSTFFGGNAGEDAVMAVAVESSGDITFAGYSFGNVPTTPRCHQSAFGVAQSHGHVGRIRPRGQGVADLLYSTFFGGVAGTRNLLISVLLDEVGDAFFAGETNSPTYPQQNGIPNLPSGVREGAITHLPLLAGGVTRDGTANANAACGSARLYTGAGRAPVPADTFTITVTNAPPLAIGVAVLGDPLPVPVTLPSPFNGTLLVNALVLEARVTDALGATHVALQVPPTAPLVPNWGLAAQWFFFTTPTCPGSGVFANSDRLLF